MDVPENASTMNATINVKEAYSSMEITQPAQGGVSDITENASSPAKILALSLSEERELRRVYDRLSDYHVRSGIHNEIADLQSWQKAAKLKLGEKLHGSSLVEQNQIEVSYSATQGRIDELRRKLLDFESNPLKTISVNDVSEMFKYLNKRLTKKDFEEMMWEVDEV